ncbi:hypothetical protein ACOSP7_018462 [Xanthoceras sorbifolium]
MTPTTKARIFNTNGCKFPAIFNFGDENSDTGGKSAAFHRLPLPIADTFFHKPSGRYSDGLVILDFLAEKLGLPFLSAYLDSLDIQLLQFEQFKGWTNEIYNEGACSYVRSILPRPEDFLKGPIGCLPYSVVHYPPKQGNMDKNGCIMSLNEVAQEFYGQLKDRVSQLRLQLPDAVFTCVDIYSAKLTLISKATKHGKLSHSTLFGK